MAHGPNKLDMEIANTIYILNAHWILKHKLNIFNGSRDFIEPAVLGKPIKKNFCSKRIGYSK